MHAPGHDNKSFLPDGNLRQRNARTGCPKSDTRAAAVHLVGGLVPRWNPVLEVLTIGANRVPDLS
jgi:hypothetical protein